MKLWYLIPVVLNGVLEFSLKRNSDDNMMLKSLFSFLIYMGKLLWVDILLKNTLSLHIDSMLNKKSQVLMKNGMNIRTIFYSQMISKKGHLTVFLKIYFPIPAYEYSMFYAIPMSNDVTKDKYVSVVLK